MSQNFPKNQIALVRVCYDLPLDLENKIRIEDSKKTIQRLLDNQNKVVLITHWSRPKGFDEEFSTKKLLKSVGGVLGLEVEFINQFDNFQKAAEKIKNSNSKIFLLENTRFEEREKSKEEGLRLGLGKEYAGLGDFFVEEAFAVSHRSEATNTEIKKFLPSFDGVSFANEKNILKNLKNNPEKPFVVIMGGAKLKTKLPIIQKMLPKADKILIGGLLSFTFVKAAKELKMLPWENLDIGNSKIEEEFVEEAKKLIQENPNKIFFPVDYILADVGFGVEGVDAGEKTIEIFKNQLEGAKTVFWNGPVGFYEKKPFDKGTQDLGKFVANLEAETVAGGGDITSALRKEDLVRFKFVSMGGGATLDFLARG